MRAQIDEIRRSGELPLHAQYTFDEFDALVSREGFPPTIEGARATVLKTTRRKVVTLQYGVLEAREVIRQTETADGQTALVHSTRLAELVGSGCSYAYDLIAKVGLESFVHGRRLKDIQRSLQEVTGSLWIPTSSLDELRRRFLFHLGQVHRQSASTLREWLQQRGDMTWLIDGTLEPGTSVFFGVMEAHVNILLQSWKIPTENADDMVPCLQEAAQMFGDPCQILHDLNVAMGLACQTALKGVPHYICHFHFASDVGEDLLTGPQQVLVSRLRESHLQVRLREQRKTQTDWLRNGPEERRASLLLQPLLRGDQPSEPWNEALGREVMLAFHFWILDYASDGSRQGFPFDPYPLYLHRRLLQAQKALARLLAVPAVAVRAPKALHNMRILLSDYCGDARVVAAVDHCELAFTEFQRLRAVLRLGAAGQSPMHHGYDLTQDGAQQVRSALDQLCHEYRQRLADSGDDRERKICTIILSHVEKYLPQLVPPAGQNPDGFRTTNPLEGSWCGSKRACRQTQGRRKLTRSFNALPSELMLVANLGNPDYVDVVLDGSLDNLPAKFAAAARSGGSYASWRTKNSSLNVGRLPRRLLRQDNLLEVLRDVYVSQCKEEAA